MIAWACDALLSLFGHLPSFPKKEGLLRRIAPFAMARWEAPRRVRREGFRFELDARDWLPLRVYAGCYVPGVAAALCKFIPAGSTVIDVGANIGYFTLHFARCVGPSGQVHAFEPNDEVLRTLRENVRANHFGNVRIVPKAIHSFGSPAHLIAPAKGESFLARVVSQPLGTPVDSTSLDAYVRENRLDNISVVKIEVQGGELEVLRSGWDTVTAQHPVLKIGLNTDDDSTKAEELWEMLLTAGYRIFGISPRRRELRTPPARYMRVLALPPKHWNGVTRA